jgi:endonuclease V-like protein UPF0215 family
LRRSLTKPHPRVIAVDDGAFTRRHRWAPLAAVVVSAPSYVEAVFEGRARVDGTDSAQAIIDLVDRSPYGVNAHAILVDGISVAGFNLIDLTAIHRELGLPVVSVTRRAPDFDRVRSALKAYFPDDFRRRWGLATRHKLFRVPTGARPIWAAATGGRRTDVIELLGRLTVRGYWPEPLRLAHLIAHATGVAGLTKAPS